MPPKDKKPAAAATPPAEAKPAEPKPAAAKRTATPESDLASLKGQLEKLMANQTLRDDEKLDIISRRLKTLAVAEAEAPSFSQLA